MPGYLNWKGSNIADFSVRNLASHPALGGGMLILHLGFTMRRHEHKAHIIALRGRLAVSGAQGQRLDAGLMESMQLPSLRTQGPDDGEPWESTVSFGLGLSTGQLQSLEEVRNGGNLRLHLTVEAEVLSEVRASLEVYGPTPAGPRTGQRTEGAHLQQVSIVKGTDVSRAQGELTHEVHQGVWVDEVFNRMGRQRRVLLEIPVAREDEAPELSEAAKSLTEAQRLLMLGLYGDAVAKTRHVPELLRKLYPLDKEKQSPPDPELSRESFLRKTETWSVDELLQALRKAFYGYTSGAAHVASADAPARVYSRDDAVLAVSLAAALLQRFVARAASPAR